MGELEKLTEVGESLCTVTLSVRDAASLFSRMTVLPCVAAGALRVPVSPVLPSTCVIRCGRKDASDSSSTAGPWISISARLLFTAHTDYHNNIVSRKNPAKGSRVTYLLQLCLLSETPTDFPHVLLAGWDGAPSLSLSLSKRTACFPLPCAGLPARDLNRTGSV